jgi:hypothetical protein
MVFASRNRADGMAMNDGIVVVVVVVLYVEMHL